MELKKRKYKRVQVEEIINEVCNEHQEKENEFQFIINELKEENKKLSSLLFDLQKKEEGISRALIDAEQKANEIVSNAEEKYKLEIEKLKDFSEKFKSYFDYLFEKYPYYEEIKNANKITDTIDVEINNKDSKKAIENIEKVLIKAESKYGKKFNPKEKIKDYIVATESNGFNMDEVLNPGELHLEEICKELGLTEDKK